MTNKQEADTALARISPDEIEIPRNWDYNVSVNAVKPMVQQFDAMWPTLVHELATARAALKAQGRRSDLGACAPTLPTWEQYCQDIGISKSQANRQISGYIHSSKKDKPPAPEGKTKCPRCNGTGYIKGDESDIIDAEIVTRPKAFRHLTAKIIRDYAKTIQFDLDGDAFLDHYDSCGWVTGKGSSKKLKDWKAAVRNWKRMRDNGAPKNSTTSRSQRRFGGTDIAEGITIGDD
jgi:hypothetical protein